MPILQPRPVATGLAAAVIVLDTSFESTPNLVLHSMTANMPLIHCKFSVASSPQESQCPHMIYWSLMPHRAALNLRQRAASRSVLWIASCVFKTRVLSLYCFYGRQLLEEFTPMMPSLHTSATASQDPAHHAAAAALGPPRCGPLPQLQAGSRSGFL